MERAAETSQKSLLSSIGGVRDKGNRDYVSAVQHYIVNGQTLCEKLKSYLDGGSLADLTEAKNCLSASQEYYDNVLSARLEYLSSQGFTDDEIEGIVNKQ